MSQSALALEVAFDTGNVAHIEADTLHLLPRKSREKMALALSFDVEAGQDYKRGKLEAVIRSIQEENNPK